MSLNHLTNSLGDRLNIYVKDVQADNLLLDGAGDIITPSITTNIFKDYGNKTFSSSTSSKVVLVPSSVIPVGFISGFDAIRYNTKYEKRYDEDEQKFIEFCIGQITIVFTTPLAPASVFTQFAIDCEISGEYQELGFVQSQTSYFRTQSGLSGDSLFGVSNIDLSTIGKARVLIKSPSHINVVPAPDFNSLVIEFCLSRGY